MLVAQVGRPRKLELKKLKAFMRLNPTLEDTAAWFEVGPTTIHTFLAEMGTNFREFREQNMVSTRRKLIRKAIDMALKGNTAMLIFCLKNMCDWRDRPPQEDFDQIFSKMTTRQEVLNFLKAKFPELEEKSVMMPQVKQLEASKQNED